MNLHEEPDIYVEFIQATAEHVGIPAAHVEKDYWVTGVLKRLSASGHSTAAVFKGGTSLSKAHRLIERFSEDVDLALVRDDRLTESQRRSLIRTIEREVTRDLEHRPDHPDNSKHGRFRRTAHAFPMRTDVKELGHVSDTLLVEINSFSDPEPAAAMPIATLVHDFLADAGQADLVAHHGLEPFCIRVLCVERTLCEKVIALVRAGYEPDPVHEYQRRIRHFYDLVMIMRVGRYREFVASDAFVDLMCSVMACDRESMPGAEKWLSAPLRDATIVADVENLWHRVRPAFRGSFRDMVYGDGLPDDAEVLASLASIGSSLTRL